MHRARLHALEDHIQHLSERGLGSGLINIHTRCQEDIVARSDHLHFEARHVVGHPERGWCQVWCKGIGMNLMGHTSVAPSAGTRCFARHCEALGLAHGCQNALTSNSACPWTDSVLEVTAVSSALSSRSSTASSLTSSQQQISSSAWACVMGGAERMQIVPV